jgi:sphingomyelin phosphodiesterase 2
VPERVAARLIVASLNTRGTPLAGTRRSERSQCVGEMFESSAVDAVCLQEVHTRAHLRSLIRNMPSFRFAAFGAGAAGPAGGLVVLSRLPIAGFSYRRLPGSPSRGLPVRSRLLAGRTGVLLVRMADPDVHVLDVHPVANRDGDWSPRNRFGGLQRAQLSRVAALLRDVPEPVVVCGDFNVARDSELFQEFVAETGLNDAFGGECPPTFRQEYLPSGRLARCIDFILTSGPVKAEKAGLLFSGKTEARHGPVFVSDHLGLCAELNLGLSMPPRRPGVQARG